VAFQGQVLRVEQMLDHAQATAQPPVGVGVGVLHTAAGNARSCRDLLATGGSLDDCWRFGVLQTLDDYASTRRRGGVTLAAGVFSDESPLTAAAQVDAAFAAFACYLADRDGWHAPAWASHPSRFFAGRWYPAVPGIYRNEADTDAPPVFRIRSILIAGRSLARA
jgi:hypothetical protein